MNFKIDGDNYSEKICKFKEIFKILCAILHVKAGQLVGVYVYVVSVAYAQGPILLTHPPELYFSLECV